MKYLAIYFLLCAAAASAQHSWTIGEEPFPKHVVDLPKQQRSAILLALQPSLLKIEKTFGLESNELINVRKNLRVMTIAVRSGELTIVHSEGPELCGASGNCAIWALDNNDRLILDQTGGAGLTILRASHSSLPDIEITVLESASETGITWYRYDGTRYRKSRCAVRSYDNSGKPHLRFYRCDADPSR